MKIKMISLIKTSVMSIFTCAGAIFLVGCEPETVDKSALDTNMVKSADLKASVDALPHKEIAQLRSAVAQYHHFETAYAAGYQEDVTGYVPHMGHHYLNAALLDDTFDVSAPEILIYIPGPNGKLRFVGVEYAVPIADLENPQPAPEGFPGDADQWVINTRFKLWTLHAWVGLNNPDGIFAPLNPRVP